MPEPDFSEVLETACRAAGLDFDAEAFVDGRRLRRSAAAHVQRLAGRFFELAGRVSPAASAEPYLEHEREPLAPQRSKSSDPQAVADELHITPDMTFSDLSRLRREFARANHPDHADVAARDNATRRMMVANMLIDRELKRRRSPRLASKR